MLDGERRHRGALGQGPAAADARRPRARRVPERGDPRDALVGSHARRPADRRARRHRLGAPARPARGAAPRPRVRRAARQHPDPPREGGRASTRSSSRPPRSTGSALRRPDRRAARPVGAAAAGRRRARSRSSAGPTTPTTLAALAAIDDPRAHRGGRRRARVPRRARRRLQPPVRRARADRADDGADRARGAARVARRPHRAAGAGRRAPIADALGREVGAPPARRRGRPRRARRSRSPSGASAVTVYLVGAGPGDPGLLTVPRRRAARQADVVVYDRLATRRCSSLAPAAPSAIDVGKAPGRGRDGPGRDQRAARRARRRGRATRRAAEGRRPVRVRPRRRGGRGAGRAPASPFEVVPGITSAIAAPAYAGIPVTHRGLSTHFTVVTGHEDPAKGTTDTDWDALARAGGTLVILMGAGRLARHRRPARSRAAARPSTPVAAVRWGTRPEQRTIRATLATIADAGVQPPSAIVVGEVAGLDLALVRARARCSAARRRHPGARAGERAARPARAARRRGRSSCRRSRSSRSTFALPTLADVRAGSCSRRPTASTRSSTAASPPPASTPAALAGVRVAAIGPGHRRRARGAGHPRRPRARAVRRRVAARGVPRPAAAGRAGAPRPGRAGARRAARGPGATAATTVDVLAVYRTVAATPDPDDARAGAHAARSTRSRSRRRRRSPNFCDLVGALPDPQPLVVSIGPITRRPRATAACGSTPRPTRTRSTASSTRSCRPSPRAVDTSTDLGAEHCQLLGLP